MPKVYPSVAAVFNLKHSGKTDWYRIENKAGAPTAVHIYDEIGLFGVSAGQFIQDLAAIKGDLEVHLSSPGGEVFDGIAIYNALRQRQPVIVVDALAASIASVIAMAARPGGLLMEPTAKLMIHDGYAMAAGNAAELSKMVEQLNSASDTIASVYASRTGKPQADWRAAMQQETWYSAQEAIDAGLADGIVGVTAQDRVLITNKAAEPAPDGDDDGTNARPPWDPDGDGDDDSTPEGDTDHSHWAPDGTQLKSVPGKPLQEGSTSGSDDGTSEENPGEDITDFLVSALRAAAAPPAGRKAPVASTGSPATRLTCNFGHPVREDGSHVRASDQTALCGADVDNSAWNAAKAWHNGAASADPAAFYGGICAGKKSGDPAVQSSWALPYKYHPSDPPNAAGVQNGLSRLPQTEGLTNEADAKALLQRLMKQINPDYEPDNGLAELFHSMHNTLKEA